MPITNTSACACLAGIAGGAVVGRHRRTCSSREVGPPPARKAMGKLQNCNRSYLLRPRCQRPARRAAFAERAVQGADARYRQDNDWLRRKSPTSCSRAREDRCDRCPAVVLYEYTSAPRRRPTRRRRAPTPRRRGVVCTDAYFLHPDPSPPATRCWDRVDISERRLADCDPNMLAVLVNPVPQVRRATRVLRYTKCAQWCATRRTAACVRGSTRA